MLVMMLRTVTLDAPCLLLGVLHDLVDRSALEPQPLLQPAERRRVLGS